MGTCCHRTKTITMSSYELEIKFKLLLRNVLALVSYGLMPRDVGEGRKGFREIQRLPLVQTHSLIYPAALDLCPVSSYQFPPPIRNIFAYELPKTFIGQNGQMEEWRSAEVVATRQQTPEGFSYLMRSVQLHAIVGRAPDTVVHFCNSKYNSNSNCVCGRQLLPGHKAQSGRMALEN